MNRKVSFSIVLALLGVGPFILAGIYYYSNYKSFIINGGFSDILLLIFMYFIGPVILLISIISQIIRVISMKKRGLSYDNDMRDFILTSFILGAIAIIIFIYVGNKSKTYEIEYRQLEKEMAKKIYGN